jgi:hypothetical protein
VSRAHREANEPVRDGHHVITWKDLGSRLDNVQREIVAIEQAIDEPARAKRRAEIAKLRESPDFWRDKVAAASAIEELERLQSARERLDDLFARRRAHKREVEQGGRAPELARVAESVRALESDVADARRELVLMGDAGRFDALVEVRPIGAAARAARDLLVGTYTEWASSRGFAIEWLRDPPGDEEPAWFAVRGAFAFGLLRQEAGLHRVRFGAEAATKTTRIEAVAVRVSPWREADAKPRVVREHTAKGNGAYGTRLRSRVEFGENDNALSVLQNACTAAQNRDLANEIHASWRAAAESEQVVRRYDRDPPLVRDSATGIVSGRPDALAPHGFDALLIARLEAFPTSVTVPSS